MLRPRAGALFKALSVFALRDINQTRLESRPMRWRPWKTSSTSRTHLAEFAKWTRILVSDKGAERKTAA